jgi:hypothetical protein
MQRQPLAAFKTKRVAPPQKRLAAPPVSRSAATLRAIVRLKPFRTAGSALRLPNLIPNPTGVPIKL